ncbi:hypothetical protein [Actinoplanes derwentensis]|uniref:hypothetical protein n=1 Tax=Actinoplanes derwentensis TaxID=113562 RepID=UPI0012FE28D2|nr:hypothetical protein [Actinoplanes derwentensis]
MGVGLDETPVFQHDDPGGVGDVGEPVDDQNEGVIQVTSRYETTTYERSSLRM